MFIELATLPIEMQQQFLQVKQGEQIVITQQGEIVTTATINQQPINQQPTSQQASDYKGDFDFNLERTKKAIGETDSNGRAKHTIALPQGLTKTQLLAWLDENIPMHLEKRAVIS